MLKCIIVDDDLISRTAMERLCKSAENLEVVASFTSAEEALAFLDLEQVNLVFLDIEMPGLSGIEFMDRLSSFPHIIITSSKTEYAFEAFEHQVVDYLKKPITLSRFQRALEKALDAERRIQKYKEEAKDVYIREEGKLVRINLDDILFFENLGDYVTIRLTNGKRHIIHGTMKGIDSKMKDPRFVKVHRSFIINLDKIKDIEENTLVIAEAVIPISRSHKQALLSRLNFL
jgi:DNA-binding LytR/AlgR family response regulator